MAKATETAALLPGYETTYILRSELSDEGVKSLQEKLNSVISEYKGEMVHTEDWGKRKLAYPISKEARGHYLYMVYTGKGNIVHEIERNLRLHDHVLRFLSVNLDKEFDGEVFRKHRTEVNAAAKRREEEREARREERSERRSMHDADHGFERHTMDEMQAPDTESGTDTTDTSEADE